jgi:N-glycosylase/DNA lyase
VTDVAVGVSLLVALAGTATALITIILTSRREQAWRNEEREYRHKERLRSLYSDVMRLMPNDFPIRLGSGVRETTKDEIDVLVSRLRLEQWHEGDHIVEQLQGVWRAAEQWNEHRDDPGRKMDLVDPMRRLVVTSIDSLEDAMRANLGTRLRAPGATLRRKSGDERPL